MAMAALAEHCEPAKLASIKIDPKEAQPFMLQAKITEALGYYFPQYETFEEEERNINRALAILNEVIDEVDNMPNLSRILQQTLFEARRRAAVCIIEKATQRKKHLGDVEAALAMGPSTNRETAAELRQAQQLLEQLFSDNRNSGGVLMPNKKDLARMHIYAGRAALLLSNTPTALHDATIHFDQAEKLSILYPAEYAWNIRESADWRAAAQQRIERRPFTTAEGVQYAGKYQQALSELRQLRHESSPRQFPIHSRAEAIGCNLARLLLQCRDIENHPQSLTMAWNAAMGSTELCISGGRLDKDKRFLPQEELSPEQRKDLQSHLANLGHLIHHAQNERFEISPEDWEFVQTFVIPHAGEAQEKLVNAVGAIERKIEGARGILNGRTPDQLGERAPELQESIRQLAAVKKELEWKLGGIRCCLQ
ncbi:hypothetical protein COV82_03375 [Candidatus Peregrinibacteria bacterium CG11_big_fil_rev_8_21_14_0_20_46_8]|nr:MAG: hypothetical protein COV82_03375 [Candidatus Peregrinibacteria bacterium CG11_big_fil_rev_8_21_14_0_20_46_8]